jgi:hypothetical protein
MHIPIRRWQAAGGPETVRLLQARLPEDAVGRRRVNDEAIDILSQCPRPAEGHARETGLVVGHVQSGKTLSYTTLASLARENGYPLIIIMTGTSVPLFEQTTDDVKKTLQCAGTRSWLFIHNPDVSHLPVVQSTLEVWRRPESRLPRQSAMLMVMKHSRRIENLSELLGDLQLAGLPALVIDDEADQASLNTRVRQDEISATYRSIKSMRDALGSHAFIQYTATPQALLLVSIIDQLSPTFVKVLSPGSGYMGGRDFFDPTHSRYARIIPDEDIPGPQNPIGGVPESLMDALAVFFIGIADAYDREETMGEDNRSMMLHPSRLVEAHADYYEWVQEITQDWTRILDSGSSGERDILLGRFRRAYNDVSNTRDGIASFDALARLLSTAIQQTLIHRMNAANGQTPTITWENRYAHILVGGQAMDRGFVVRGLTVTYMPRNIGVGNADTLQQRARFFGYKADIMGYCRVWLESTLLKALRAYVEHEEDVRESLQELEVSGTPVSKWRREFVLSPLMNLTRSNVFDKPLIRSGTTGTGWIWGRFPYITEDTVRDNKNTLATFLKRHKPDSTFHGHDKYSALPLRVVRDELVAEYRTATPSDSVRFAAARERLDAIIQAKPNEICDVFYMKAREYRTATEGRGIEQIFQGRGRTTDYPGDRKIVTADRTTVQIHEVDVRIDGVTIQEKAPVVAIRFPDASKSDQVYQPGNL